MKKLFLLIACLISASTVHLHAMEEANPHLQALLDYKQTEGTRKKAPYGRASYLSTKQYAAENNISMWGFAGTMACLFGGISHAGRKLPINNHVYAGGCVTGAAISTALLLGKSKHVAKIANGCSKKNIGTTNRLFWRNSPESARLQKIRTRTLLDGYDTIKNLEGLSAQEVQQLATDYTQQQTIAVKRLNERLSEEHPDAVNRPFDPLHDPALNLLSCAKTAEGRLAIPAAIEKQKQDEAHILAIIPPVDEHPFDETYTADGTMPGMAAVDRYASSLCGLKNGIKCLFHSIATPAAAIAGYIGAYKQSERIPHRGLRMGLCIGSALTSAVTSFKLTNFLYPSIIKLPGIRSCFNNLVRTERKQAIETVKALGPDERTNLQEVYGFGHTYGYIPRMKRDSDKAAQYKEECRLASDLINGVIKTARSAS